MIDKMTGKVTRFATTQYGRPYGIITDNTKTAYYFDGRHLNGCSFDELKIGTQVDFVASNNQKGKPRVRNVTILEMNKNPTRVESLQIDHLFEEQKYLEFLCSPQLAEITPDKLSTSLIQKMVNSAFYVLKCTDSSEEIEFNNFDKLLINTFYSNDFLSKKGDEELLNFGMQKCINSCTIKIFKYYFNAVVNSNTYNNTWLSLTKRFQITYNKLYIYFYVIAICTSLSVKKKNEILNEYLKFIEDTDFTDHLYAFLSIFKNKIFSDYEMPQTYLIRLLAMALDRNKISMYADTIKALDVDPNQIVCKMLVWLENEIPTIDELVSLLDGRISIKFAQKYINYYWYTNLNNDINLNIVISLLSGICLQYPSSYIEEIIYNINNYPDFKKFDKIEMLRNMFGKITLQRSFYKII